LRDQIPRLSPDRKLDLLGLAVLALGAFSLLSWLSPAQGALSRAWLRLLEGGFGWGSYLLAPAFLAVGVRLLLRHLDDRLPRLRPAQLFGLLLLYGAGLAGLQASLGLEDASAHFGAAASGRGGGVLGAALLVLLQGAFGAWGAAVLWLTWVLWGVTLVAGLSVTEVLSLTVSSLRRLASRWVPGRGRRATTPLSPISTSSLSEQPPPTASPDIPASEAIAPPPAAAGLLSGETPEPEPSAPEWPVPIAAEILEPGASGKADEAFDRERAQLIEDTLLSFGAPARVVEVNRGPTITQFGVEPDFVEGRGGRRTKVKVSKISALADDLALALAAPSIRIEAPVPGKGYVGIEVPNPEISLVSLRDVMESPAFQKIPSRLRLGLGQDVSGRAVAADLAAMPHLLIAGTTGSGKSVCVNAIIACLLLQNTPDQLRVVMIDPKRVELTSYNGVPHLLAPVVVDLERVVGALQWISREMDERYRRFAHEGVRNIADFNRRMELIGQKAMPYLVLVIDELADLMMMAPDETERLITRLAQLARATGIHLVIATQRPSVDVVTGLIKANFPARIAFAVASSIDSRVILDQPGAERLLGRGDMLFHAPDAAAPIRMQGAFVSEPELNRLIRHWKNAALGGEMTRPHPADPAVTIPHATALQQAPLWETVETTDGEVDELFDEAVEVVRRMRRASISLLQRHLRIGYTRSARLIDQLEARGIVGPAQSGSLAREVLDYGELPQVEER
jgi:S-DNA-T family DNA segregation ATPase FtsK/SpoIIIE